MKLCTRCGINTHGANTCPDCDDVFKIEARRAADERRIAVLLKRRDAIDTEIAHLIEAIGTDVIRRPRHVIPPCGTESAYQRHRNRREKCPMGDDCKKAHAAHERATRVLKTARKVTAA